VPGEQIVAVGTLAVPAAGAALDVARAGDAVRLFADRAGGAKRGFTVSGENVRAVVEVCQRLDSGTTTTTKPGTPATKPPSGSAPSGTSHIPVVNYCATHPLICKF
jgi:hypothetical protein